MYMHGRFSRPGDRFSVVYELCREIMVSSGNGLTGVITKCKGNKYNVKAFIMNDKQQSFKYVPYESCFKVKLAYTNDVHVAETKN